MAQVLVQPNKRHEQTRRNVGARAGTLTRRMSRDDEHGLPFLTIRNAFDVYPQSFQTADVVLVMAEQRQYGVNGDVNSYYRGRLHSSGPKQPCKWHLHTLFDGISYPNAPVSGLGSASAVFLEKNSTFQVRAGANIPNVFWEKFWQASLFVMVVFQV
jgi:hypothetical protein